MLILSINIIWGKKLHFYCNEVNFFIEWFEFFCQWYQYAYIRECFLKYVVPGCYLFSKILIRYGWWNYRNAGMGWALTRMRLIQWVGWCCNRKYILLPGRLWTFKRTRLSIAVTLLIWRQSGLQPIQIYCEIIHHHWFKITAR